jgi:hypothetical protein
MIDGQGVKPYCIGTRKRKRTPRRSVSEENKIVVIKKRIREKGKTYGPLWRFSSQLIFVEMGQSREEMVLVWAVWFWVWCGVVWLGTARERAEIKRDFYY